MTALLDARGAPLALDRRTGVLTDLSETQWEHTLVLLNERIAELELALEDDGWQRLTGEGRTEFSNAGLKRIIALSRLAYLKNPLINRSIEVQKFYVWGQGVTVSSKDQRVNAVVQSFMDDPKNRAELTSHQALGMKEVELATTGNLFFVLFVDGVEGAVRVRTIPPEEILDGDIICNPDDAKEPWLYKRVWQQTTFDVATGRTDRKTQTAYYPDWRYQPNDLPQVIGDAPVQWDTPVCHVKAGGFSDMRFGIPETYAALDWAKAYKAFLEDWATIIRALSRFVFNLTVKGGPRGVTAARTKLGTTLSAAGSTSAQETNPPPVTGSTFIGAEGIKLEAINKTGASTSADDGRRMLLMVAAAMGLPESFYGDVSVGTLATAKSLDRPTELKFTDRQILWGDVLKGLLGYAAQRSRTAPKGQLAQTAKTGGTEIEGAGEAEAAIEASFPPILEHDVAETVNAIVTAATLNNQQPVGTMDTRTLVRLLLQALGVEEMEELLDQIAPEGGESLMDQLAQQRQEQAMEIAQQKGGPDGKGAPREEDKEDQFMEALRELREVLAVVLREGKR